MSAVPARPKIYHIVHVDKLASIVANKRIWCDEQVIKRNVEGSTIGMVDIKRRRLTELRLESHPNLFVGQFTPFYFCPRSVMLYLIYRANHPNLTYKGGQGPIVHLEADLHDAVEWAVEKERKWAFTLSNAGAKYFEDRSDLRRLKEINWDAVSAQRWNGAYEEGKQAEFLMERYFPWHLVERIGYLDKPFSSPSGVLAKITDALRGAAHKPVVEKCNHWYY